MRRGIEEMKARGATTVDIVVPDLAKLIAASNLLTQELKVYLGDYLKDARGYAASIEEMLETGLHSAAIQGILDVANGTAADYLSSDDYRSRLSAREALAKAVIAAMEADRLDAIAYPTIRRIAPIVGGAQAGSNAALSANSGLPAITVPAGFTAGGFPVGIELIGRRFAEPTLLALAFDFEQSTHHRRSPSLSASAPEPVRVPDGIRILVKATGAHSVPVSNVAYARQSAASHSRSRHAGLATTFGSRALAMTPPASTCTGAPAARTEASLTSSRDPPRHRFQEPSR